MCENPVSHLTGVRRWSGLGINGVGGKHSEEWGGKGNGVLVVPRAHFGDFSLHAITTFHSMMFLCQGLVRTLMDLCAILWISEFAL